MIRRNEDVRARKEPIKEDKSTEAIHEQWQEHVHNLDNENLYDDKEENIEEQEPIKLNSTTKEESKLYKDSVKEYKEQENQTDLQENSNIESKRVDSVIKWSEIIKDQREPLIHNNYARSRMAELKNCYLNLDDYIEESDHS